MRVTPKSVLIPIAAVAAVTVVGEGLERVGLIRNFYCSPYVAAVALIALVCGRRLGAIAAILAMLSYNLLFVQPAHEFSWPTPEEWVAYSSIVAVAFGTSSEWARQLVFDRMMKSWLVHTDRKKDDGSLVAHTRLLLLTDFLESEVKRNRENISQYERMSEHVNLLRRDLQT